MRLASLLIICLLAAACSRPDGDRLKQDTQAVGHDVAGDVRRIGDDPGLKDAGDHLKAAAHDAGDGLHKAGQDIRHHGQYAADR